MATQPVTLRFDVPLFSRQPSSKTWRFWRCPWPASRRWATPSSTRRSTPSFGRSLIGWGKRLSRCSARNNHISSLPLPCLPSRHARGQMSVFNIHCVPWIIKRLTFVQALVQIWTALNQTSRCELSVWMWGAYYFMCCSVFVFFFFPFFFSMMNEVSNTQLAARGSSGLSRGFCQTISLACLSVSGDGVFRKHRWAGRVLTRPSAAPDYYLITSLDPRPTSPPPQSTQQGREEGKTWLVRWMLQ